MLAFPINSDPFIKVINNLLLQEASAEDEPEFDEDMAPEEGIPEETCE